MIAGFTKLAYAGRITSLPLEAWRGNLASDAPRALDLQRGAYTYPAHRQTLPRVRYVVGTPAMSPAGTVNCHSASGAWIGTYRGGTIAWLQLRMGTDESGRWVLPSAMGDSRFAMTQTKISSQVRVSRWVPLDNHELRPPAASILVTITAAVLCCSCLKRFRRQPAKVVTLPLVPS